MNFGRGSWAAWASAGTSNNSRSCFSDSPTHLDNTSAPFRMKNVTFRSPMEHAFARERAMRVLPVPGGPAEQDKGHLEGHTPRAELTSPTAHRRG